MDLVPTRYEKFCIQLANTYDPCVEPVDVLSDPDDLSAFLRSHGFKVKSVQLGRIKRSLIALRSVLRAIPMSNSSEQVAKSLGKFLGQAKWQIEARDNRDLTFVLVASSTSAATIAAQTAALGAISLIQRHGIAKIRRCKASPCVEIFCDTSKSGRQVFCSKKCANRFGIAAFRERRSVSAN